MSRVATNYEFINASALPEPINLPFLVVDLVQTIAGGICAAVQRCRDCCCAMGAVKPEIAPSKRRRASIDTQTLLQRWGHGPSVAQDGLTRKYSTSLDLLGAAMGENSKRRKNQKMPKGVPEEFRARDAYLQLLSSGRQRTANDQAAGERINQLQGTLTQLSMAQVHDRKLLLEVREMVLELRHQDGGTTHRASYRAGNGAPASRAQALQEEVLALATTLEAKLDEFKGCIATLQQSQTALSQQPLPTGGRTPSPDVTVRDMQQRADYSDPLGC